MEDAEVTNLELLKLFRQCAHMQRRLGRFPGQGYILILLSQSETLTQHELAEITQRRSATLSEQLEMMESAGLITREKNAADKRNIDIRLTDKGKQTALEAERESAEIADVLFSALETEERTRLCQTLRKLKALWQEKNKYDRQDEQILI